MRNSAILTNVLNFRVLLFHFQPPLLIKAIIIFAKGEWTDGVFLLIGV